MKGVEQSYAAFLQVDILPASDRIRTCNLRLRRLPHYAETPAKQHVTAREFTKKWYRFQGFTTGLRQSTFRLAADRLLQTKALWWAADLSRKASA